jgi:hypothetical protein
MLLTADRDFLTVCGSCCASVNIIYIMVVTYATRYEDGCCCHVV